MSRKNILVIFPFLFLLFSIGIAQAQEIEISNCSVLDQEGATYKLTVDIINYTSDIACIDITANNIVFDCQGHTIDGEIRWWEQSKHTGILVSRDSPQTTNITIKNCVLSEWHKSNIKFYNANGNRLENITTLSSDEGAGVYLFYSSSNVLKNIVANFNYIGFDFQVSESNIINNATISSNHQRGVFNHDYSNSNVFTNMIVDSNEYGFYFDCSSYITINNSKIQNNTEYGFYVWYELPMTGSFIYNNLFNNTVNVFYDADIKNPNYWNTTRQVGERIYSAGTEIGGNYWTNPDGNGYSDTCTDTDKDGFCDEPYEIDTNNIDYLPLSNKYSPFKEISNCSVLDQEGKTYVLTADIIDSTTPHCIDITANNVVFDCQGHTIDADKEAYLESGIYVYRSGHQTTNITIKNCVLSDWENTIYLWNANSNILANITTVNGNTDGIYLDNSDSNNLTNIITKENSGHGIYLSCSDSNNLTNIIAEKNTFGSGVYIHYSSSNILANITTNENEQGITFEMSSNSNNLTNIIIKDNVYVGIYISESNSNIIKDSRIQGSFGIDLYSSENNLIYNNLFNNTNNFFMSGTIYVNNWNTTRQVGERIYSAGTEIGGNYWTNPDGNGYSDTCTDADKDGFCDEPYQLNANNTDYLPLSNEYTYLEVTPQYTAVNFGTLQHNTSNNSAPAQASGIYNFTVDTSANYKVEAYGTDFSGTTSSFAISNLRFDTNTTATNLSVDDSIALSATNQTIDTNIPPTETVNYHGYWLAIPSGQYAEDYSATITITITNV